MKRVSSKRRKSLSEQDKAVSAAMVLLDAHAGRLDEQSAGRRLRDELGLQWSFTTCLQYLSGKSAITAISALPSDWSAQGRYKTDLITAVLLAADVVAHVRVDGTALCASELARGLRRLELACTDNDKPQPSID